MLPRTCPGGHTHAKCRGRDAKMSEGYTDEFVAVIHQAWALQVHYDALCTKHGYIPHNQLLGLDPAAVCQYEDEGCDESCVADAYSYNVVHLTQPFASSSVALSAHCAPAAISTHLYAMSSPAAAAVSADFSAAPVALVAGGGFGGSVAQATNPGVARSSVEAKVCTHCLELHPGEKLPFKK